MINGKLELVVKINQMPHFQPIQNGWQEIRINCDGYIVRATLRPKACKKLTDANTNFPEWVASITGKIGDVFDDGFELLEPNIQVFEKKAKEEIQTA